MRELNASAQGSGEVDSEEEVGANPASFPNVDVVICSFALHLLEDLSQRWALLSVLSWKATWLIGLGLDAWNFHEWTDNMGAQGRGTDILEDRYTLLLLVQLLSLNISRGYIVVFTGV